MTTGLTIKTYFTIFHTISVQSLTLSFENVSNNCGNNMYTFIRQYKCDTQLV